MDIILDSNIYRSDFLLRSSDFEILLDYLGRTDSSIYFPQIVLDEIKELHKRALRERVLNVNKANNNLKLLLTDESKITALPVLDENIECDLYIEYIKKKLKISDRHILPPKDSYFPEVTRRAIKREKPCGEDGQGFRDTIIWLTLKDFCLASKEQQITFISNNDKDFANADKTDLHDSLVKECESLGIKINYFKSIRDFIEKQSVKIDFITEEWLLSNFDMESFNDYVLDYLNGKRTNLLTELIHRKSERDCSGYSKATHANTYQIYSFSVYEMLDSTFIVNAAFSCEIEVEYEYYGHEYDYREVHSGFGPGRHIECTHQYFDTEIYASLSVKDKEIIDYEIDDIYM